MLPCPLFCDPLPVRLFLQGPNCLLRHHLVVIRFVSRPGLTSCPLFQSCLRRPFRAGGICRLASRSLSRPQRLRRPVVRRCRPARPVGSNPRRFAPFAPRLAGPSRRLLVSRLPRSLPAFSLQGAQLRYLVVGHSRCPLGLSAGCRRSRSRFLLAVSALLLPLGLYVLPPMFRVPLAAGPPVRVASSQ